VENLSYSARGTVEQIIFRAFSIAVLLTGVEVVGNAIVQNSVLKPTHWLLVGIIVASQVGLFYGSWFALRAQPWLVFHGISPIIVIVLWPLLATDVSSIPDDYRPWVWWAMGMSAISLSVVMRPPLSVLSAALLTAAWFVFTDQSFGGEMGLERRVQDSVLVLFLGAVFGSLARLIIGQFGRVDKANSDSLRDSVARAQKDAVERERGLVDALVHDRVLNTLLLAGKAKSEEEYESVANLASQALAELETMGNEELEQTSFSTLALVRALKTAVSEYDNVIVTSVGDGSTSVPAEVAEALTQASLQAVENSRRHSGAPRTHLKTESGKDCLEIRIKDHGKGFRLNRVSRNRLGLRLSIIGRVESVGGQARIISKPGVGTEVILRWTR